MSGRGAGRLVGGVDVRPPVGSEEVAAGVAAEVAAAFGIV
jgi:hypothetical protein